MKTLYLLRHAKSSWDYPGMADFDRPLNGRGRETAPFMGELMRVKAYRPSLVLSSPAVRARTTAELVKEAANLAVAIRFDERIYEASPTALLSVVSETEDSIPSAMIVGHNPGIEGFIRLLTGQSGAIPTAALAVIRLSIDSWRAIDTACGELEAVYRPKEVKAELSADHR
jgi:phosphohistidine phosphatase